jgi:hypothetical protein
MSNSKKQPPLFRVGDWVSLVYGRGRVLAQVVEDRGPLGVSRQRLYRIRLDRDPSEAGTFEVREEYLEAATKPEKNGPGAAPK